MNNNINEVSSLSLDVLINNCQEEKALFSQNRPTDSLSCLEIWRRACQGKNEAAYEALYSIYHHNVRQWTRRVTVKWSNLQFEEEALINGAFWRAFRYINPQTFAKFPNLKAIMQYLKVCSEAESLNEVRHQMSRTGEDSPIGDSDFPDPQNPIPKIEENLDQELIWHIINQHLAELPEKLVIYARFVLGMPRREIVQAYPQFFPDDATLNNCLRRALWQLKKIPELEVWFKL